MSCQCARRRFVRSLEEDEPGLPNADSVTQLAATKHAFLGRCRSCGAWWERLPHETYGYAWHQTEQSYWDATDEQRAIAGWTRDRREQVG
ncbi:MAG: hypothetical protein HY691_04625 [Chloroflexi bacterium]|nr:hypothetical protein [Chloroflexota bacterium]